MPTSNPFLRGRFPRPTGKAAKRPIRNTALAESTESTWIDFEEHVPFQFGQHQTATKTLPAESKWIDLVEIDPETGVVRNKVTPGVVKPLKARKMPRLKYRGV